MMLAPSPVRSSERSRDAIRNAVLVWLLELIALAPDPFATRGTASIGYTAPGTPEAIELEVLGHRFRIVVEDAD